ncbi:hypothetical protein GGI19_002295 [Coemansia pectinata]|uniref:Uncharacterized protein n=1 Tax=Coemansia pectinata TaxID=1052879 RepID=A0A9W8LAG0_9FUNG|nr:hypothetical protein GGI19_002295 [Coemansia pectinata]
MDAEEVPQLTDSAPPPPPPPLLQAEEDATSGSSSNAPIQTDILSPAVVDDQAIVPNTPTKVAEEEEEEELDQAASDVLPAVQEMAQELADELAQGQQRTGDISGGYSTSSSLYGGSLSLVGPGGADASIGDGRTRSIIGLAPTLGGGTLSPPHTLVNSDGASMRVHTGSIRERNFNRRISAIHEDDSDVYSESRRSDSMIFSQTQQPSVSPSGRRHQANYQSHHGRRRLNNNSIRHQRRMSEDDNSCMPRLLSESDCLSIVSGISEGGASTTRVRLATDRAYDALRIGAPPAVIAAAGGGGGGGHLGFGYIHHYQGGSSQYPHRAMSFATSSDPGLPSTGSFYDYYLDPNDYVPNSGSTRDGDHDDDDDDDDDRDSDDSSECGHRHHHRRRRRRDDEDIVSLIRSDIAVYGSAVDDVKFPFLPDNFSEFSGSVVYSPNGAIGTDCGDRGLRELTEAYYAPQYQQQSQSQSPQQQQQSSEQNGSRASSNKKSRRGKDRLIIRNGKTRDLPSNTGAPIVAMANTGGGGSSQIRGNSSTSRVVRAVAAAGLPGPSNRPSRHYRRQSASEAYPSTTTVTVVAVASTSTAAAGIRQANSSNNSPAIRPNALMRFFKRITPKN